MKTIKGGLLLACVVSLTACINLLESDRDPLRIYTLAPPAAAFETPERDRPLLHIAAIKTAPGLDSERILLRRDALRLEHFAAARWAERSSGLVHDYLSADFRSRGTAFRVADATTETHDYELRIELRAFEADYRKGRPPTVNVDLVAVLRDDGEQRRVMLVRRVSSLAADDTLGSITDAFDAAMSDVSAQLARDVDAAIGADNDIQGSVK